MNSYITSNNFTVPAERIVLEKPLHIHMPNYGFGTNAAEA